VEGEELCVEFALVRKFFACVSFLSSMQSHISEQLINDALPLDVSGFDVALDNYTTRHITFE
jgi:hypothetical protein